MSVNQSRTRRCRIPGAQAARRRQLVPLPSDSHEASARFHHEDLASLSDAALFAEETVLIQRLSEDLFAKRRDRAIWGPLTRQTWMRERLRRLAAERRRRTRARWTA